MRLILRAAWLTLSLACFAGRQALYAEAPAGQWRDVSVDDYRQHLEKLSTLTAACAKARDMKTCDPALVGADDRIPLIQAPGVPGRGVAEHRVIRYGWLRVLLARAQQTDKATDTPGNFVNAGPKGASAADTPRTTSQLLEDAQARIAFDRAQASGVAAPVPDHAQERAGMGKVLAEPEFKGLKKPDRTDSWLEKLGNWLDRVFAGLGKLEPHSAWLGWALTYGFLALVAVGLVVALLRLERRWRVRLVPESVGPAAGAASARDWQLWLKDARRAADAGRWREAVHCLYWAAISRLESKRLWPADRARTPREYLALVAGEDARRAPLAALTGDFERIWYGGRAAGEGDYRRAEQIAAGLMGTAELDSERAVR